MVLPSFSGKPLCHFAELLLSNSTVCQQCPPVCQSGMMISLQQISVYIYTHFLKRPENNLIRRYQRKRQKPDWPVTGSEAGGKCDITQKLITIRDPFSAILFQFLFYLFIFCLFYSMRHSFSCIQPSHRAVNGCLQCPCTSSPPVNEHPPF